MPLFDGKEKPKGKECNCCIEIEDSIVVIICGEIEIEKLKGCLKAVVDQKGTKVLTNEKEE